MVWLSLLSLAALVTGTWLALRNRARMFVGRFERAAADDDERRPPG